MSNRLLEEAADLVRKITGVVLPVHRYDVLRKSLAALADREAVPPGMVLKRLATGDTTAWRAVVSAITIGETYFFRDYGHFEVLSEFARARHRQNLPTHVLCAGSATGEEAWSCAAVLAKVYGLSSVHFSVTGWEIDASRIAVAQAGKYGNWSFRKGFYGYEEYFQRKGKTITVAHELGRNVVFRQKNLAELNPEPLHFDIVFFRNVAIYWERVLVDQVVAQLTQTLRPDGLLFVGSCDMVELPKNLWKPDLRGSSRVFSRQPAIPESKHPRSVGKPSMPKQNAQLGSSPEFPPFPVLKPPAWPQTGESWLDAVRSAVAAEAYHRALEIIRSSAEVKSGPAAVWEGIVLLHLESTAEAVDAFRYGVFLEPDEPAYRHWLAVAYELAGHPDDAARELRNLRKTPA
jgi:chemotaxis protein methyltransferase CheR